MVYFIGLEVLVSLEKRSKRLQDKIDLEVLQELTKSTGVRSAGGVFLGPETPMVTWSERFTLPFN